MNRCACCHQIIPPEVFFASPLEKRIYKLVKSRPDGVSAQELVDASYQHDPNGGPLTAKIAIRVRVLKMNKELAKHGVRIGCETKRKRIYALRPATSAILTREQILWHEATAAAFSAASLYPSGTSEN